MTANEDDKRFQEAVAAYIRRFGRLPRLSPDAGSHTDEIMHAALTGIDLDDGIAQFEAEMGQDGQRHRFD